MNRSLKQLQRHEGFSSHLYSDSEGVLTIGYGTNIDQGITEEEASWLLNHRLQKLIDELPIPPEMTLNDARRAVLHNMVYNLGVQGLLGFTKMWFAAYEQDWETAAKEMLDSKWARQVGQRAIELAEQMRTGEWQ